ncbi:MAG: [FeFe] hydrogenase H-cluster radical SAM maturase HydE [Victivallales bacterium]|jgi:biotin synthase|nr:[FeFe] hydrogenase H-cluster radical SAM maturase HydE [Victivallales bacterium]
MTLETLLAAAVAGDVLSSDDLAFLLRLEQPDELQKLYRAAYEVKLRYVGNKVNLRGLVEVSNVCRKNCFYCGIRRGNTKVKRFGMSLSEILEGAQFAAKFRYGSFVLQAGERSDPEWVDFIENAVREIKKIDNGVLGITLSLGEQSYETYQRWFDAGAHRYLLRIESSDPELYAKLHPADHSYFERVAALETLREIGYQVGTGVMSGLPMQTVENLVHDIEFFKQHDIDMIGMGPYIVHRDTPLGREFPEIGSDPERQLKIGLKMIAVTRLYLRNVNIASTTALQALAPNGRELGLLAGANVIMPNVGDLTYRQGYLLYENKPGTNENIEVARGKLERAISGIGESIAYGQWGDSPHFAERQKK